MLAGVLLAGCGAPDVPDGAPESVDSMKVGASEQLPGATPSASAAQPTGAARPPGPLTEPFTCPEQTITPLSADELRAALADAQPGDVIAIEPGVYYGHFTITAKGTAEKPIFLCGPRDAALDGRALNSGYVLHLDGAAHWRLSGFTVRNGAKGVVVDSGTGNVLQNMRVEETGEEAVHLRANSTGNVVQRLSIRKTGKVKPEFGEGLYVGTAESNWCEISDCEPDRSDGNYLLGNKIAVTTAEAIDVKEGTSKGVIAGNTFDGSSLTGDADSWVDVKGNDWSITGNQGEFSPQDGFQTHVILAGWGDRNVFAGNSADLGGGKGVGYYLHKPLKNRVACDNTVARAVGGLSNAPCQG